jgi:hypothetical protein
MSSFALARLSPEDTKKGKENRFPMGDVDGPRDRGGGGPLPPGGTKLTKPARKNTGPSLFAPAWPVGSLPGL